MEAGRHGGRKTGREEASLLGFAVNRHTMASDACTVTLVWCFDTMQRWYGVLTCTGARTVALIWQLCGIETVFTWLQVKLHVMIFQNGAIEVALQAWQPRAQSDIADVATVSYRNIVCLDCR